MIKVEVTIEIDASGHQMQIAVDRLVREDWTKNELMIASAIEDRLGDILEKAGKKTKGVKLTKTYVDGKRHEGEQSK